MFLFAKQTNPNQSICKTDKQEVNGTVILPPLAFRGSTIVLFPLADMAET
jgi:hypothetical protein